jgi:hypothetical protein
MHILRATGSPLWEMLKIFLLCSTVNTNTPPIQHPRLYCAYIWYLKNVYTSLYKIYIHVFMVESKLNMPLSNVACT